MPDPLPVAEIRELAAPREDGGAIPIRPYRSATPVSGGVLPALVYFHGDGWVIGDLDMHDSLRRHLANAAQCVVVSADYRLAPEHKFPAAVEDCFAATSWVAEQAAARGVDTKRQRGPIANRLGKARGISRYGLLRHPGHNRDTYRPC
jgi:acetyl esterase